jgi:DNA polymerase-3 subunit epsilon
VRLNTENYKLGTLCQYFGIPLTDAHEAMADVMATAEIFQSLIEIKYEEISKLAEPFIFPTHQLTLSSDFNNWTPRTRVHETLNSPYDFHSFLNTLPQHDDELNPATVQTYLTTLHTCLINDSYSYKERERMEDVISSLSLSFSQVIDLNEEYLFLLICRNLTNNVGRWSDTDTASMNIAREFTGIRESRVDELTTETLANRHVITTGLQTLKRLFSLQEGDAFVLSGEEFNRGKRYWEYKLLDSGFIVKPSTTKQGIKAVICNDPYSLSNKAVAARNYGIPILTENTITNLIKQHR